jgi:lysine 2,3-aminomutase
LEGSKINGFLQIRAATLISNSQGVAVGHKEDVSIEDWSNWRWHLYNRVRTAEQLEKWVVLTDDERTGIDQVAGTYDWFITPYYASLMDPTNPTCPIRLQSIPSSSEMVPGAFDDVDPVGDTKYRATNRVIHKYPDRVVFLATSKCPVLCRFCTRKYHTTAYDSSYFGSSESINFDDDIRYIAEHPEIRDVLLTGGDPLSLGDKVLDSLLGRIRAIAHVEIVRIGTRFPVLLPQRITPELCEILRSHGPLWINTHFNHPVEMSSEASAACGRLVDAGIPVGNQTVLLRNVNDSAELQLELSRLLVRNRVRPYYLYHCDNVRGVSHFQTSLDTGRAIMRELRGFTTGFSVPEYIATTFEGKISLAEENVVGTADSNDASATIVTLRSYLGRDATFPIRK